MKGESGKIIKPTLILFGVCLIAAVMLALTFQVTDPVIKAREKELAEATKSVVLPDGKDFVTVEDATLISGVKDIYKAENGAGYVLSVLGSGYGGQMELMIGIGSDGAITGINPISNGETKGIGSNTMTPEYLAQFVGATAITNKPGEEGTQIDTYTGATISSKAVFAVVRTALEQYGVLNGAEAPKELTPEEKLTEGLQTVLPGATSLEKAEVACINNVVEVYKDAGGAGYAVLAQGTGFAGEDKPIKVLVGVDASGAVTGLQFIEHGETDGIGTEAFTEAYAEQFVGATAITLDAGEGTKIDVVTGATFSSKGIFECVQNALDQVASLK